jgi:amidophosphoribosyltransferase
MAGEAREKCAVAGIVGYDENLPAAGLMYESLFAMQHRGAEATGMVTQKSDGSLGAHRELGLIIDVFREEAAEKLVGSIAVGHNRYSTSGLKDKHMQPYVDEAVGFAMGHNGNLPITSYLDARLSKSNVITSAVNDSEKMGIAIAQEIRNGHDLPAAIELAFPLFKGAFSCVAMHGDTLVGFRDSKGVRPLALGEFDGGRIFASETCALDIVGAKYEREVSPGEMVILTPDGSIDSKQINSGEEKLDIFEFVYFARHDSYLYGRRVNEVRRNLGRQLAEQHPPIVDDLDNVLVVPIPDTSVPAAEGYAETYKLRHRQGIIKNRYIGRTFMQPSQLQRQQQLRRKHAVIDEALAELSEDGKTVVKNYDVILIDDSIVRGNTIPNLVLQVKAAGARSVTVLIASPPVRFPDFYGIDTPSQNELVAANITPEKFRKSLKHCEYLGYLSLDRMVKATGMPADKFNLSCFNGEYPIGIGSRKAEIYTPVSMEYID